MSELKEGAGQSQRARAGTKGGGSVTPYEHYPLTHAADRTESGKLTKDKAAIKLRELAKQLEIIQHDIRQCVDVLTEGEQ